MHGGRNLLVDDDLVDKFDFLLDIFFVEDVVFAVERGEFFREFDDFFAVLLVLSDEFFDEIGSFIGWRAELNFGEGVK